MKNLRRLGNKHRDTDCEQDAETDKDHEQGLHIKRALLHKSDEGIHLVNPA